MRAVTLLGPPPSLRSAIRDVMEVYWSFPSEDLIDSPMFSVPVFSALLDLCQTCHSQSQPHLLQMIANVICHIYGREFPVPVAKDAPVQNTWNRGRFVLNDRATADVLLRIQGTNVYAHSYVLGKASVKLGEWLEKGQKQGAVTVVEVADGSLSAKEFVRVMQLVYGGGNYSSNGMTEVEALAVSTLRDSCLLLTVLLCSRLKQWFFDAMQSISDASKPFQVPFAFDLNKYFIYLFFAFYFYLYVGISAISSNCACRLGKLH